MRIDKINKLIKQELGKIIQENVEFGSGVMVTISAVDTTQNLASTKVWLSIFPQDKEKRVFDILEKAVGGLQKKLNRTLSLKYVPKIIFKADHGEEYAEKIDEMIENLD